MGLEAVKGGWGGKKRATIYLKGFLPYGKGGKKRAKGYQVVRKKASDGGIEY